MTDRPALVIGLGNPGPQYERTRHNVGAVVVDTLAERMRGSFSSHKRSNSDVLQARLGTRPVVLGKPRSYMNESGGPVANLARFFSVAPADIIVVHDELDVDLGRVRLKIGGGEGGHNGLRSISKSLSTKDYLRVRVGVGRPPGRMDPASYVLKPFAASERDEVAVVLEEAADAVELLLKGSLEDAQNRIHRP
ncbi:MULTISPECIES: aminoacyl-tRNA hydrolase [unclassified Rhodococcus (in: high G+C Gram-positive bacteria)]|jgi:PTH1 family peptidyl-tRNA hydrolase|uniref:aminoacyl-tRNA hydrolase n=1 Tax=unclassified Rhodococcus (in: high G+C Gram-positive bacteria) TaxID=192944 RepID=UPI00254BE72E|nr:MULTISPECIES: aminoacyl-tRNA hydrolase [unclassified Rhodococcus (in: high G+C Gram-positive bacteria)]